MAHAKKPFRRMRRLLRACYGLENHVFYAEFRRNPCYIFIVFREHSPFRVEPYFPTQAFPENRIMLGGSEVECREYGINIPADFCVRHLYVHIQAVGSRHQIYFLPVIIEKPEEL